VRQPSCRLALAAVARCAPMHTLSHALLTVNALSCPCAASHGGMDAAAWTSTVDEHGAMLTFRAGPWRMV